MKVILDFIILDSVLENDLGMFFILWETVC